MVVGAAGNKAHTAALQLRSQSLRIVENLLLISAEFRLKRFSECDCLSC